jgi:hypothetical protein
MELSLTSLLNPTYQKLPSVQKRTLLVRARKEIPRWFKTPVSEETAKKLKKLPGLAMNDDVDLCPATWAYLHLVALLYSKDEPETYRNVVDKVWKDRGFTYEESEDASVFLGCNNSCFECDGRYTRYLLFNAE